jgi:hypothetical protein
VSILWNEVRIFRAECSWCQAESGNLELKLRAGKKEPERQHLPPGWAIYSYVHESYNRYSEREELICPECVLKWERLPESGRGGKLEFVKDGAVDRLGAIKTENL